MKAVLVALPVALAACAAGESCPGGLFDCAGTCVDLGFDNLNCGSCGSTCDSGEVCAEGTCTLECPEGDSICSGTCRDLSRDDLNCGACGNACPAGERCLDGACTLDCPDGYSECSGICRDLENDPSSCGSCGNACSAGMVCSSGSCTFTCPDPYVDCSGSCADLEVDHGNCGACGTACGPGEICTGGDCVTSCYEGLSMCSGSCADLMRDPSNCGSCGRACDPGEVCYDGACTASCPGGFTDCSGSCRDLDSDRLNCGACGNACASGEVCEGGSCAVMCVAPLVDCSGVCSDTGSDPDNCGSCGHACASVEACVDGTCESLSARTVLVYYDSFTTGQEPAERAATRLGWPVTATNSSTTFASSYDTSTWGVVVIDVPGSAIPTDVRTRVLDRLSTGGQLIFSWWDLDTDSSLASSLGVSTTTYSTPNPVYPTSGASVNFFTSGETFPVPLTSSDDAGDNGDYLALTSGGEIVCSAGSSTGSNLLAITHSGSVLVLGFLPWDYKGTDNDSDTVPDMTEMFVNMLRY